jgi:hypothetical protein
MALVINLSAQSGTWIWMGGGTAANTLGIFGTQGFASVNNNPPALYQAQQWKDNQGNFWIFGGVDSGQHEYSDLWKFDPVARTWTWVNGPGVSDQPGVYGTMGVPSPNNMPGARGWGCGTWIDSVGDLWLFGGEGYDSLPTSSAGNLSDLWRYNIASNQWTLMAGPPRAKRPGVYGTLYQASASSVPAPRSEANCCWMDRNNNLWLFGGYNYEINWGCLNDIWRYSVADGQWAWMGGSQTINGPSNYGTLGVESAGNWPSARNSYSHWVDSNYLYFAGGGNFTPPGPEYNDVWRFNLNTNYFTWVGGDTGNVRNGQYTHYCSTDFGDKPEGLVEQRPIQLNGCSPSLFMWGGLGDDSIIANDLWSFDLRVRKWRWVNGDRSVAVNGNFGTMGVSSPTNMPPGLMGPCFWSDYNGNFWLWGGQCAFGPTLNITNRWFNAVSTMWEYIPDASCFPSDTGAAETVSSSDTIICAGDSVQLCSPPGFITYSWSNGDTSACTYVKQSGNYYVIANSSLNCHAISSTKHLNLYNPAPVTLTIVGDTLTTYTGGTYQWYFNNNIIPGATSSVYIAHASGDYSLRVIDSSGCPLTSGLEQVTVSGIEGLSTENLIAVYPNPSNAAWHLSVSSKLLGSVAEVFDATGRIVFKSTIINQSAGPGGQLTIEIPDAASGVYELRIISGKYSAVKMLVKE